MTSHHPIDGFGDAGFGIGFPHRDRGSKQVMMMMMLGLI